MKILKFFIILILFTVFSSFTYKNEIINEPTNIEYKIFLYKNGDIVMVDDGDNDCVKIYGENLQGDFEFLYSFGC